VGAIETAGYVASRDGMAPASLRDGLAGAPARRPAGPNPRSRWREIVVDDAAGTVERPTGVRLDTGGTGKGLCADAVACRLAGYARFLVDCGGDIAVGGVGALLEPFEIDIEHPLSGERIGRVSLDRGGIATSGLNVRIWHRADGSFAHHLLDPATGAPAWTGLIGATALGGSALEAETLSKMALLSGPDGARRVLAEHGGLIVHDSGETEAVGPLAARLSVPASLQAVA
jgi:thiamine biosynthesis lipoprotein